VRNTSILFLKAWCNLAYFENINVNDTVPILIHQMCISKNHVFSVILTLKRWECEVVNKMCKNKAKEWDQIRGRVELCLRGKYFILIDWLIICGFTSCSRIFHLYGDVTIAGEGLQNLGLCSALRAFEQGGIFIVPHLLWHRTSVFPVSSEGTPHSIASYDSQEDADDLFLPGSWQVSLLLISWYFCVAFDFLF
jgi:hypothetical protein